MRTIEAREAAASVHAYASANGRDVMIEPHPKWSHDLGLELLQAAKDATPINALVPDALQVIAPALRGHLVAMVQRRELVEYNDGKWYRDAPTKIAAADGDRYTTRTLCGKCGGPISRCACYYEIRDAIRAIATPDVCPKC